MEILIIVVILGFAFAAVSRLKNISKSRSNIDDPEYILRKQYETGQITQAQYFAKKAKL